MTWFGTTSFGDLKMAQDSENPSVLDMLSKVEDPIVRASVAENPNSTIEILFRLAQDSESKVKLYVLRNRNLPLEVLLLLLESNIPLVKREAYVKAIMMYRQGKFDFEPIYLLKIMKELDPTADQITLVEAVENLHKIREGTLEPKRLF